MATSTCRLSCLMSVWSVAEKCGPVVSSGLFSLRAFTGCVSVSYFKGIRKIKPFELMKETGVWAHFQTLKLELESDWRFIPATWKVWPEYFDRKMFLLSMLLVLTSFKQLTNLIVHCHLAKIVNGYMQQGQITGLLFGENVFPSILTVLWFLKVFRRSGAKGKTVLP